MAIKIAFGLDRSIEEKIISNEELSDFINIVTEKEQTDFISEIESKNLDIDILILGESIKDPISIAQRFHFIDKDISIIILCSQDNYYTMVEAIQFAPFLGEEVSCLGVNGDLKEFNNRIKKAVTNTIKRRAYRNTIANINTQIPGQNSFQLQTSRYVDKLVDFAPISIVLIDGNFKILAWNKQSEVLFGLTERDALGTSLLKLFNLKEQERIKAFIASAIKENSRNKELFKREIKPKNIQFLETHVSKINDISFNSALLIFQDITESELAQEALLQSERKIRSLNEKLEEKVIQRTKELEEANEELKRSNGELQNFAYVASHDLQEPLRKIISFSNLLETRFKENLPDQAINYINLMSKSTKRMSTLITDLLTYSRVTTEASPLKKINLRDSINDVIDDLEIRIEQSGADIEVKELCTVYGDPLQIRLLFQNLISNAIKYQKSEVKPKISIHSEQTDDFCTIYVKDNGIGIDEQYSERIFGLFQRLHGRDEYEGTGIGLSICKKIVERHKGIISVKSEVGKGSTFIIKLPIK